MDEIILHHYAVSPFSEKIRKILAVKNVPWRAVEQPVIAPKPALTPLTGGYRRIPVLQLGADIYCDTALIARVLETIAPEPSIFPDGNRGAAEMIAHWADHWLFLAMVPPVITKMVGALPPDFIKDRQAMSPGFTAENLQAALPDSKIRVRVGLDWLGKQVESRDYLFGSKFSVADAACFHNIWFMRNDPETFALVEANAALKRWFDRVDAFGNGDMTPLDPQEALAIAQRSLPMTPEESDGSDPLGIKPGDTVSIVADDYGVEVVKGTAVLVNADEIALRRDDPSIGELCVHFPRAGYRVTRD